MIESKIPVLLSGLVLTIPLYVSAATASIYDSYQPGITAFQIFFSPLIWLLIVYAALVICNVCGFRISFYSPLLGGVCALLIVTFLIFVFEILPPPTFSSKSNRETADLPDTIRRALFTPSFSNRSYMYLLGFLMTIGLGYAIVSLLVFAKAYLTRRSTFR